MRVMCINDRWTPSENAKNLPRPKYGDIDVVVETFKWGGFVYYELERFGPPSGYLESYFITLDGPDEGEHLEAWQEKQAAEYDRQFADILESIPDAI